MCFTSIFHFFFFRRLSTILLVKYFLFLNVTNAKIFDRYDIFLIVYFVIFSLANIINISCRFSCASKTFEAERFSQHTFISNKITNRGIFKTNFFFWGQFSDVEILSKQILFHRVHFNYCTVNKLMRRKLPFMLFPLIFYQKLFLDEFSEIAMKLIQNPGAVIRRFSTK